MTDLPYTEETLDVAEGAVAKACGGRDDDRTAARYVLDALFEAGLLVTPRQVAHAPHCQMRQAPPAGWPFDGFSCNCGAGLPLEAS